MRIRHPNIVTFWGTAASFPGGQNHSEKPYIGMVFELCEKGSLYRAVSACVRVHVRILSVFLANERVCLHA